MAFSQTLMVLAALAGTSIAAPANLHPPRSLSAREVISYDAIVSISECYPDSDKGTLYAKYKPNLDIVNGCVPFPAVDTDGNTSGGLKPTGSPSGDCSNSAGQIYVRGGSHNGHFAVMYSWYFPKTEPSNLLGHRHDWQSVVVWLDELREDASVMGVAVQQGEEYDTTTSPNWGSGELENAPLVKYVSHWPKTHKVEFADAVGDSADLPLIAWESMGDSAQDALNTADFGDATCPFKDEVFADMLDKALLD